MNQQDFTIFYDLEKPIPIMFWDPMEFTIGFTMLGFGIVTDLPVIGGGLCVLVLWGGKYLKKGQKNGGVQHFLWRMGLQIDGVLKKYFPAPWVLEFIE